MPPRYIPCLKGTEDKHFESRRKFLVKMGSISLGVIFIPYVHLFDKLQTEAKELHKDQKNQSRRVVPRFI